MISHFFPECLMYILFPYEPHQFHIVQVILLKQWPEPEILNPGYSVQISCCSCANILKNCCETLSRECLQIKAATCFSPSGQLSQLNLQPLALSCSSVFTHLQCNGETGHVFKVWTLLFCLHLTIWSMCTVYAVFIMTFLEHRIANVIGACLVVVFQYRVLDFR